MPLRRLTAAEQASEAIRIIQPTAADRTLNDPPCCFWVRCAQSHASGGGNCRSENPAACSSSWTQAGYGWSRQMYARSDAAVCVTAWVHGENNFSPEGFGPNGGTKVLPGSVWFRTSARP